MDGLFHARIHRRGASQVASTLLAEPHRQVAGSALAMHGLALRSQAETLLGALMGFDLGAHGSRLSE